METSIDAARACTQRNFNRASTEYGMGWNRSASKQISRGTVHDARSLTTRCTNRDGSAATDYFSSIRDAAVGP